MARTYLSSQESADIRSYHPIVILPAIEFTSRHAELRLIDFSPKTGVSSDSYELEDNQDE